MEPDLILEMFRCLVDEKLVDSKTYKDITVDIEECLNHVNKGKGTKLRKLVFGGTEDVSQSFIRTRTDLLSIKYISRNSDTKNYVQNCAYNKLLTRMTLEHTRC